VSDAIRQVEYKPGVSGEVDIQDQKKTDILTVAGGGSVTFVGNIANRGLKYAYNIALIWGLGAENFGLYTLALAIISFFGVIATLGMNLSIIRFGAIYTHSEGRIGVHRTTSAAMRIVMPFGFLLMFILWFVADLIAVNIFSKPELTPLIRAMSLSVPFIVLQMSLLSATTVLRKMKYSVIVWIFQPLIGILLAIPLMVYGIGIQAVALSISVSYIFAAGLALYFYMRIVYTKEKSQHKVPLGKLIRFSLPLTFTQWIQFAYERTEIFFLGLLPGAIDVGIYKMAWSLAGLEPVFRESLSRILAPFSSDLSHRKEMKQLEDLYKTTAKWSFSVAFILFLIFLIFARPIMNVFDPGFVTGTGVLIILGLAHLISAAIGPSGTILIMSGRSDLSLLNTIVLFVVSITLDWLLIPKYGLTGAALAGGFAVILLAFLRVIEIWLTLRIHPFKMSFSKPLIAGLSSGALVYLSKIFLYSGGYSSDIIYVFLLVMIYIGITYLLKLDEADLLVLKAVRQRVSFFNRLQK
jgi:O-antigen/teichoic acid export membrane protein